MPEATKLAKHLKRYKDSLWGRWKDEYLRALRDICVTSESNKVKVGHIVLIKDDNKNRGKWKLGVVTS